MADNPQVVGDTPPNSVLGLLETVGFTDAVEHASLVEEVFPDLRTINMYTERDLKDIFKEFRSRTIAAGRITIPCIRIQRTLGLIHWVQDAYHCNQEPVPADFNDVEINTSNGGIFNRPEACLSLSPSLTELSQPPSMPL
jgi:hypothetical protein